MATLEATRLELVLMLLNREEREAIEPRHGCIDCESTGALRDGSSCETCAGAGLVSTCPFCGDIKGCIHCGSGEKVRAAELAKKRLRVALALYGLQSCSGTGPDPYSRLSDRTRRLLSPMGVESTATLLVAYPDKTWRARGFGRVKRAEVEQALLDYGMEPTWRESTGPGWLSVFAEEEP